ncbi:MULTISPECIES: zinc-binding alcohol dehydrogenase family protein [Streptomyces]|nr:MULTISPECIES: zinc-binding alcohol dehydrogenase family protein [Streptomyces]UUA07194.1 zinc-binding alcohol dehydrogenase family protein [Streptomyces koelreuteriae]UUA14823.1 zinc-binding alcohol dehydrogenase family protein [Streptomyces sp. CRCS-T-1]
MTGRMTALVARGGREITDADAFVEQEVPVPELRARDLLVRVRAVSVNPVDTKIRTGLGRDEPKILGYDVAGTVEAIGPDVTRFAVGDEVYYAGDVTRNGGNSACHAVDERVVGSKPTSLSFAEAAALPLTTLTAWEVLFDHFRLGDDSAGTLLVLGGAGGVGSIAVQLAKRLTSLEVLATASRDESRAWALAQGADGVVNHHRLVDEVRSAAPQGVNYVLASQTAGNVDAFAEIVAPFGHIAALDEPPGLDILPLKTKSIAWHWQMMFTRSMFETADMAEQGKILDRVGELVDEGTLRTTLRTAIPGIDVDGLRRAHELVASGKAIGKVVLHD